MNAALSILLSLTTVLAGGAAALGGDLIDPFASRSAPTDDCVAGVCLGGGHGNQTGNETGNGTSDPEPNGTGDPEPEPEPEGNGTAGNGTHHHHHHHHHHNGTDNRTQEPEKPEDVHFCTTGLVILDDGYTFSWEVHSGFELFELDWHYQDMTFDLLNGPDVYVSVVDGAGNVVLEAEGEEALHFSLETDDLRGYAPGEWTFTLEAEDVAAEQGLVGSVEY